MTSKALKETSNHRLLHILWTKAVGTPGYNKEQWMELERRLERKCEVCTSLSTLLTAIGVEQTKM